MKTNLIYELQKRVYNNIAEKQLMNLLIDGQPLMTSDELTQHITDNLIDYLTPEEQKQLVAENAYNVEDEDIKSLIMKFAIEMASLYVQNAIIKALSNEDFIGNNPFSVHSNPQLFMIAKYFDEELGIKLQP